MVWEEWLHGSYFWNIDASEHQFGIYMIYVFIINTSSIGHMARVTWQITQKNKVLEIEGKKVKRQVVDGEGVYMLYNRLRRGKNTVVSLCISYQNRFRYHSVWKRK